MIDKPLSEGTRIAKLPLPKSLPSPAFKTPQLSRLSHKPPAPAVYQQSCRLHRKQAAHYLGMSVSWLDKARLHGGGPIFISIGGRIVYDLKDLEDFLQRNRHASTSEQY